MIVNRIRLTTTHLIVETETPRTFLGFKRTPLKRTFYALKEEYPVGYYSWTEGESRKLVSDYLFFQLNRWVREFGTNYSR